MARGRNKSVTIRDVAEDAGVSLQTVSRVINDGPNVRPQMRDKVQASIDRLGYVPSLAAQRMSGSRSYIILAINDRERTLADWRERQGTDWVDQMLHPVRHVGDHRPTDQPLVVGIQGPTTAVGQTR